MRKIFLFAAAMMAGVMANAEAPAVATFEDIELPESGVLQTREDFQEGLNYFESGDYKFNMDKSGWYDPETGELQAWYYYGFGISNRTESQYEGGWDAASTLRSVAGGAHNGNNYAVWYQSRNGFDHVDLKTPAVVPGFYITNCAYTYSNIVNGDGMSIEGYTGEEEIEEVDESQVGLPFGPDDFVEITIYGMLNGDEENMKYTKVFLAQGAEEVITDWQYVSLEELGEVNEIGFVFESSKHNQYGITTATYFCVDDFGAEAPQMEEGVDVVRGAVPVQKFFRNGQLIIRRGERFYDATGRAL